MDKLIALLNDVVVLCKNAKELLQAVGEILKVLNQAYRKLTPEAASEEKEEFSNFQKALGEAKAASAAMMKRYDLLKKDFDDFKEFTDGLTNQYQKVLSSNDIDKCQQIACRVLDRADNYFAEYPDVKAKLERAIEVSGGLCERCKIGWQIGEDTAANTRIVGYGFFTVASLGAVGVAAAVSAGNLDVVTGGLGALGLAGIAVVGGLLTRGRANRLDKLAANFKAVYDSVKKDIKEVNQSANKIEEDQQMTPVMADDVQILLMQATMYMYMDDELLIQFN